MSEDSIFVFRRDHRLYDNLGWIEACSKSRSILPIFIFDPRQIGDQNKWRSLNSIRFMLQSLVDLRGELDGKLCMFHGDPSKIVADLIKKTGFKKVYATRDYTPFSVMRDEEIKKACENAGGEFITVEDSLLHPIGTIVNSSGTVYQKFTPFYNQAKKIAVKKPASPKNVDIMEYSGSDTVGKKWLSDFWKKIGENPEMTLSGGRRYGLKILKEKSWDNYGKTRDILSQETTHLSAYLKFGCVSIREAYHAFEGVEPLKRQLYWREFYTNLVHAFPHLLQGKSLKQSYDAIKWNHNEALFQKWCKGVTGFPLVDAGMRELNTTGYMHNRGRLVTSNFLIKVLGIDWRKGEQYFATMLVDYDPSQNNGNWQWSSGSGADSQPYFRVFNPYLQSKRFDPDCTYIKKWIPELKDVSPDKIHKGEYNVAGYPQPVVDYKKMKDVAMKLYEQALK